VTGNLDFKVIFRPIDALNIILCVQLTHDLFAIAKFLFYSSSCCLLWCKHCTAIGLHVELTRRLDDVSQDRLGLDIRPNQF